MSENLKKNQLKRSDFLKVFGTLLTGLAVNPGSALSLPGTSSDATWALEMIATFPIIVPDGASQREKDAAEKLRHYLSLVSKDSGAIKTENEHNGEPAIHLGNTALAQKMKVHPAGLGEDGFAFNYAGKNLFLSGGTGKGLLYGVFHLLETIGFRKYSAESLTLPEKGSRFPLPKNSFSEVPFVHYRSTSYHDSKDAEYSDWHGLSSRKVWGMFVHTFEVLIPPKKYGKTHPEYFSLIDGKRSPVTQLCLSNEEVFRVLVAELRKRIEENPDAKYWSVSQNDNDQYCRCDNCTALNEKYGNVPSGSITWFVNKVAREFPDKMISTLAYWYSRKAPENIEVEPNVNIMLCNIESTREKPVFVTDPAFTKDLQDWGKIANDIIIWDYNIQFASPIAPFPNLYTIAPNIQFYTDNNVRSLFMQATGDKGEFAHLRGYLISKLMWNPALPTDAIIHDFVSGYYGPAGSYIKSYIDLMQAALEKSGHKLEIFGYPRNARKTYLTYEMMQQYKSLFDEAENAVRDQQEFLQRVRQARLPLMFAELEIGQEEVDTPRSLYQHTVAGTVEVKPSTKKLVSDFISLARDYGIVKVRERAITVDDYEKNFERIYKLTGEAANSLSFGKQVLAITEPKRGADELKRLTDGIFGSFETWRGPDKNWVLYEGNHMDFVLDLGEVTPVNSISMDFLNVQAQADWNQLCLPKFVTFSFSADGKKYSKPIRMNNPHNPDPAQNPEIIKIPYYTFAASPGGRNIRFVKVHAESLLKMPRWHIRAGLAAQIYSDEIIVS